MRQHTYGVKRTLSQLKSQLQLYKWPNAQTAPAPLLNLKFTQGNKKYMRNILSKRLVAIIGLALAAAVAAWQFYLFVVIKDVKGAANAQSGMTHLWVAIGIAVLTCIAAVFFISKFLRYDGRNEMHITSQGHPAGAGRTTEGRL